VRLAVIAGRCPGAASTLALAVLLASALPWTSTQGQADGGVEALAEELRQLREAVEESSRADRDLFLVSLVASIAIAGVAVGGTVWNALLLRKHVNVIKKDMDERLRPLLRWTADGDRPSRTFAVIDGNQIKIRIINAGQVAAVGIVLEGRMGLTGDFEAGRESRYKGAKWGSLAPNKSMEVDLVITDEDMRRIREKKERLHVEILLKYQDPGGKEYEYALSGHYDGEDMILRD